MIPQMRHESMLFTQSFRVAHGARMALEENLSAARTDYAGR